MRNFSKHNNRRFRGLCQRIVCWNESSKSAVSKLRRYMKHCTYKTQGTCSQLIDITLNDSDEIVDVKFLGGCNGNLKGICALIKGKKAKEVKECLKDIRCGSKSTSCPDQLATALEQMGI